MGFKRRMNLLGAHKGHRAQGDDADGGHFAECRHHTFHWMQTEFGSEIEDVSPSMVVETAGVPHRILFEFLTRTIEQESALLSLPFALLLVLVFGVAFANHDCADVVRDIHNTITFDLEENANFAFTNRDGERTMGHKAMYDANFHTDFYSWLRLGLRPLIIDSGGVYLAYSRVVGGIRLQQFRAAEHDPLDSQLSHMYGKPVYPDDSIDLHDKPNEYETNVFHPEYSPEKTIWIHFSDSHEKVDAILDDMVNDNWMNEGFVQSVAAFVLYNGVYGTLTYTTVSFMQSRSGHLWRTINHETLFMQLYYHHLYPSWFLMLIDGIFVAQISYMFFSEVRQIVSSIRTQCRAHGGAIGRSLEGFVNSYINVWNVIDWICIVVSFAFILSFLRYANQIKEIREILINIDPNGNDAETLSNLFDECKRVSLISSDLRIFCVFYPIIIMLRLFKAFASQPRLALVTRTLSDAGVGFVHFAIAFSAIFISYVFMGMLLFGREVTAWSDVITAMDTTFSVLMGEYDMESMRGIGHHMANVWFMTYLIIVMFLMLNMLLAIVLDVYSNVKYQQKDAPTLFMQMREFYRRWKQKRAGLRVSLDHILKCYSKRLGRSTTKELLEFDTEIEGEHVVTVEKFVKAVPGLQHEQARRLLVSVVEDYKLRMLDVSVSLSESLIVLSATNKQLANYIRHWKVYWGSRQSGTAIHPSLKAKLHDAHANMMVATTSEIPAYDKALLHGMFMGKHPQGRRKRRFHRLIHRGERVINASGPGACSSTSSPGAQRDLPEIEEVDEEVVEILDPDQQIPDNPDFVIVGRGSDLDVAEAPAQEFLPEAPRPNSLRVSQNNVGALFADETTDPVKEFNKDIGMLAEQHSINTILLAANISLSIQARDVNQEKGMDIIRYFLSTAIDALSLLQYRSMLEKTAGNLNRNGDPTSAISPRSNDPLDENSPGAVGIPSERGMCPSQCCVEEESGGIRVCEEDYSRVLRCQTMCIAAPSYCHCDDLSSGRDNHRLQSWVD